MPLQKTSILTITASDATGFSGLQTDIKTISELGSHPLSVITTISMSESSVNRSFEIPTEIVGHQVTSILAAEHPCAIKVGMIRNAQTIRMLAQVLKSYLHTADGSQHRIPLVCAPGVLSSKGARLIEASEVEALKELLIPMSSLLMLRCNEAEIILGRRIGNNEEMVESAKTFHQMGAQWIMLRGGRQTEGRCTALLYGANTCQFFASYNIEGWNQHGVGGALSAATATRLAFGDDIPTAITRAHDYVSRRVVYSLSPFQRQLRPSELYNRFLSLIAQHYRTSHDVTFYAQRLSVSTRYLGALTNKAVGKSPKQVIAEYLVQEATILLETSHLNVQEVAQRIGFPDTASFSKFFRHHTGNRPSDMKNNT